MVGQGGAHMHDAVLSACVTQEKDTQESIPQANSVSGRRLVRPAMH